jgi:hypothetical protein
MAADEKQYDIAVQKSLYSLKDELPDHETSLA